MGLPKDRTRAFATRLQTCVLVTPTQWRVAERDICPAYLSAIRRNTLERHERYAPTDDPSMRAVITE